jgi:hypothetical protein
MYNSKYVKVCGYFRSQKGSASKEVWEAMAVRACSDTGEHKEYELD